MLLWKICLNGKARGPLRGGPDPLGNAEKCQKSAVPEKRIRKENGFLQSNDKQINVIETNPFRE
jgi:hypothetical protein